MKINQAAVAGTLESGDVMIRIAPLDSQDIDLQVNSSVEKQFGDAIRQALLKQDLDAVANHFTREVRRLLAGIQDESARAQTQHRLSALLQ